MTRAPYYPRRNSLAMRVLRHMQLHAQPMSRRQMRAEFGATILNHLEGAVRAGLLSIEGSPEVFHPTAALATAVLDGKPGPTFWTEESGRIQLLRRRYPTTSNERLAKLLGATVYAVAVKASELGLRKTPDTIRRHLQRRELARPYVTTSPRTERILQLMREGCADGATAAHISQLIGVRTTAVGNALRRAVDSGLVERRPINQRHYTYHLNRAHKAAAGGSDDGQPVQIVVPATAARAPITTAPNSVFALGCIPYPTTATTTATAP